MSGGTLLSISGQFPTRGTQISISLDNIACQVNKTLSSSQRLVCVTGAYEGPLRGQRSHRVSTLTVHVDNAVRNYREEPFTYTPDPRVLELKPLRSPYSGGRVITVHGSHLDAIQVPKITGLFVYY